MLSRLRKKYEEENRSRLSAEQGLAAMDAAKAHMRDCVARDDFGGMQRLKSILAGVIPHRMVQFFRSIWMDRVSDEQKQKRLISAREYTRHCLRLNAPDDLRVDVLAAILPWAEYWKLHDFVEWVKQQWARLRLDY